MRIDSGGNVGIGTTSPAVALDVQGGTSNTGIAVRSTDTRAQVSYIDNATTSIGCVATGAEGDDFFIRTGSDGAKKLTIKAGGNVGIGTTSPAKALEIKSGMNSDGLSILKGSNSSVFLGHNGSGDEGLLQLKDGGTTTIQIYGETGQTSYFNAGKVGIGTTSPNRILSVKGNGGQMSIVDDDDSKMQFYCNSGTGSIWATGGGGTDGSLDFATTPNGGSTASRMQISASGNVTLNTGNLVIGTAGKGIDFSATSGTGTSELLDDYEEGSWTGTVDFGGGTTGITYSARQGRYTKIGRLVHASFVITLSNKGSSNGNTTISGLPFTATNDSDDRINGTISLYGALYNITSNIMAYNTTNQTSFYLYDGNATTNTALTDSNWSNSGHIRGFVLYHCS
jgi:hypothetical protein